MHLQVATRTYKYITLAKSLFLASWKCPRTCSIFQSSFTKTVPQSKKEEMRVFKFLNYFIQHLPTCNKQESRSMIPWLLPIAQRLILRFCHHLQGEHSFMAYGLTIKSLFGKIWATLIKNHCVGDGKLKTQITLP